MNGCLPYFPDLKNCPQYTMTSFPKSLVLDYTEHIEALNLDAILEYTEQALHYTRKYLTTENLFKYIIQ